MVKYHFKSYYYAMPKNTVLVIETILVLVEHVVCFGDHRFINKC